MNHDALNSPPQDSCHAIEAASGTDAEANREQVGEAEIQAEIRVGSPFATDPFAHDPERPVENLYDIGPMKYTALGAVSASVMVVGFAAAAAYFFPLGGTLIAALGCGLSIFGMYSSYRRAATGLLAIHVGLFVLSYGRTWG